MGRTEIIILLVVGTIAFLTLVVGIILFVFQFRSKTIHYNSERALEAEQHRQHLLSAQLEMQEQTMQHIGREIHDNVGQKLTLASLYAQQISFVNQYPTIAQPLLEITNLLNVSLEELRNLSKNLTDNQLASAELGSLLQMECDKVNGLNRCLAVFNESGPPVAASLLVKTIVLRVAQEFIQNSLKYAACQNISMSLHKEDDGLYLEAADDGKGFDTTAVDNKGIGLQNMAKRAEMIGATLLLESKPGKGTTLRLFIPVNKLKL